MLKYLLKTVVLMILFFYIAYAMRRTISNIDAGQVTKVTDKNVEYKKIVKNNDIYTQLSDLIFYGIILGGAIIVALSNGIETTTILTILGSIGLALALSTQNLLNNVLSGVKLALTKTIKIGDNVELRIVGLPLSSVKGKVTDISLFSTKVALSNTNEQLIIPNSIIENTVIVNSSIIYT